MQTTCSSSRPPLDITPKAALQIREIAHSMGRDDALVRITARPNVPEAERYELEFIESQDVDEGDDRSVSEGVQVVLDKSTLDYMRGTRMDFVQGMWTAGFRFENPNASQLMGSADASLVQKVLEEKVAPTLGSHGGAIRLVDVRDGRAFVELSGGCQGCGLAPATLNQTVKRTLMESVPGLRDVVDVTDHSDSLGAYYSK